MFDQDGWILASFFFCEFMDLDFVSVHKHAKKELDQYPAILASHLVNNPYLFTNFLVIHIFTIIIFILIDFLTDYI